MGSIRKLKTTHLYISILYQTVSEIEASRIHFLLRTPLLLDLSDCLMKFQFSVGIPVGTFYRYLRYFACIH
jgi:hypothetical protein